MISTCALVKNHQKGKCRQKHLLNSHAGATDGETTRTEAAEQTSPKKHILVLLNVEFNARRV